MARRRDPGGATGAGSAEVRKASGGADCGAVGKCGRGAEEVRNLFVLTVYQAPMASPSRAAAVPALSLVRAVGRKRREGFPAAAPFPRGCDGLPAVSSLAERD
jgi:hypothetical protein